MIKSKKGQHGLACLIAYMYLTLWAANISIQKGQLTSSTLRNEFNPVRLIKAFNEIIKLVISAISDITLVELCFWFVR